MEALGQEMGDEARKSPPVVEVKTEDDAEIVPPAAEIPAEESTDICLEEEYEKWTNLKNFLGISGIKSDARLAGFLVNFWYEHKDCKELERKARKSKKNKQRYGPIAPKVRIPIRMTSRGRPIYQPSILQVKQTSDYKTKRTKRQMALQKKQEAIKKAIKQEKKKAGRKGKAKTKRKIPKTTASVKTFKEKFEWRSEEEDEEDDLTMDDEDDDYDYQPRSNKKPKSLATPAAKKDDVVKRAKPGRPRRVKPASDGKPERRRVKRGEKLPPKKRKYLDRSRLKGETWYRCRIKKMMIYPMRFQCKICLQEVKAITQVIDHIQNEHPDQIAGFRSLLGPHLERCGLTVVWRLPESESSSSSLQETLRDEGSTSRSSHLAPGRESEGVDQLSPLGNEKGDVNEGEENAGERGDGFAMGGGILKGGYMSLLVGGEAAASRQANEEADAQREGDEDDDDGDEEDEDEDEDQGRKRVAIFGDKQSEDLLKDKEPRVIAPEEDIDVLYELQGWIVIMIECPDCKEYVSIYSLPRHQFHHNKPKQEFPCDKCSKVYCRLNLLRNHQKRHQEKPTKPKEVEKTFMCELCGDVFRKAKYLKNHQLRHEGNLPFVCKICGRRFLFQRQLKRHDIIHRDVKPILCQECGRGFVQRSQLNAHMRQHTGEKPYKCDLCDRAFTHNVSLKTHKKRDHGVNVSKCANPHVGRPKRTGEGSKKSTRSSAAKKAPQARNQSVISSPPVSQYSECRMVTPTINHMPLGLVINPDRQGMDLSMDSPESPPSLDNSRGAIMPGDRTQRERQLSIDRPGPSIHGMDNHSRNTHGGEAHSGNLDQLGNPHMERPVISMDRHAGGSGGTNSGASSLGNHGHHSHFERSMGMPLIERSIASHLMDRQALSPPIDSRPSTAHSHHMDHHHQGGLPLLSRPDLNQHLMRQKKGKDLDMPPHQNNPPHPPYPWGAWGNVGEGMGMRFPVFPQ